MAEMESLVDQLPDLSRDALTAEQQQMLSKVLFPETHQDKVTICGKERTLHALPIKWDRKLHEATLPFASAMEDPKTERKAAEIDKLLDDAIQGAMGVICEAYGKDWWEVKQAFEEGDLLLSEIQAVVITQQELQGKNNFFLTPLRIALRMMQAREIAELIQGGLIGTDSIGPPQ